VRGDQFDSASTVSQPQVDNERRRESTPPDYRSNGHPRGQALDAGSFLSGAEYIMDAIRRFLGDEEGQDVVEYGLLIATIAIVVLVGVGIFGNSINGWFKGLAAHITTVGT
jgi:pilus assembly protein Flp/PilA